MGDKSKIEWTDATWGPIRGCSRVSEGCRNCYAEKIAARFSGPGKPYDGLASFNKDGDARWTGKIAFVNEHLDDPLRWTKPRMIFVNSMSDLFHERVSDAMLLHIFTVMANTHIAVRGEGKTHTFQVLTKRPARMLDFMRRLKWKAGIALSTIGTRNYMFNYMPYLNEKDWVSIPNSGPEPPKELPNHILKNVWLGVSVEDQATADERIPFLLQTPAAVRFVSYEPALGPIDFTSWTRIAWRCSYCKEYFSGSLKETCPSCGKDGGWCGSHPFNPKHGQVGTGLNWVICGGESGPSARPMHPDWARSARDQCVAAEVPYFFKQWGDWIPFEENGVVPKPLLRRCAAIHDGPNGYTGYRVGKKAAGRRLDGREWNEMPRPL